MSLCSPRTGNSRELADVISGKSAVWLMTLPRSVVLRHCGADDLYTEETPKFQAERRKSEEAWIEESSTRAGDDARVTSVTPTVVPTKCHSLSLSLSSSSCNRAASARAIPSRAD